MHTRHGAALPNFRSREAKGGARCACGQVSFGWRPYQDRDARTRGEREGEPSLSGDSATRAMKRRRADSLIFRGKRRLAKIPVATRPSQTMALYRAPAEFPSGWGFLIADDCRMPVEMVPSLGW